MLHLMYIVATASRTSQGRHAQPFLRRRKCTPNEPGVLF